MTRIGKCDVCRVRKVRCDQSKPNCSECQRKGRPCSYEYQQTKSKYGPRSAAIVSRSANKQSDDGTGLSLRDARAAGSGPSEYCTFALMRPPAPLPSDDSRLAARWVFMLGPLPLDKASSASFYGIFRTIASRVGADPVLDAAASYTVESHRAFMTEDPRHQAASRRSGARAARLLRLALDGVAKDFNEAIPVAVLALKHAEYFVRLDAFTYQLHVLAQSALLKVRWTAGRWGELEQELLRGVFLEEIEEAVFADTASELDDSLRHAVQNEAALPEMDELTRMYDYCMEQSIMIPRLVHLVRQCSSNPDPQLAEEAIDLAKRIYDGANQTYFDDLVLHNILVKRSQPGPSNPLGRSLEFLSTRVFILTQMYFMYRNMICGLILRMLDLAILEGSDFDQSTVEAEDVRAAEHIVMCANHALDSSPGDPPFKAMRLHDPITMAYAAWNRLSRRECERGLHDQQGERMKEFCKTVVCRIMELWHAGPELVDIFEATAEAFEGGPPLPQMSRRGQAWTKLILS